MRQAAENLLDQTLRTALDGGNIPTQDLELCKALLMFGDNRPAPLLGPDCFAKPRLVARRTVEVANLLHGMPLSQAQYILREAERLLMQAHVADVDSERFRALSAAIVDAASE